MAPGASSDYYRSLSDSVNSTTSRQCTRLINWFYTKQYGLGKRWMSHSWSSE